MSNDPKPRSCYTGLNQAFLGAVPAGARRILDVGCAEGNLGAALKQQAPGRTLFGVERQPETADLAARKLDQVFIIDVSTEDLPLEPGSLDCILFDGVLEHLVDPEAVLRRLRKFLAPGGQILCSIPNLQHHSMLDALLTGDFQHTASGMLDATHPRFFTASTIPKLLLDAGYEPNVVETVRVPCPPAFLAAARPLFDHFGLHHGRMAKYLGVHQYIVRGRPLEETGDAEGDGSWTEETSSDNVPLSIVACVSDESILQSNLLASPDLGAGSPHEIILSRGCSSAAAGLNPGIEQARHPLVVLTHQDVYLPRGWPARLVRAYRRAERRFGSLGVAGVYGVASTDAGPRRVGHVVDRDILRAEETPLPVPVATLDELLMVVPRDTSLRFDRSLGFHFYGADLCLAARERGLSAVALDALCFHNSRTVEVSDTFLTSATRFAGKWAAHLPIATPCALIDRQGQIQKF
jgi:SAM-dependent methyltransferase